MTIERLLTCNFCGTSTRFPEDLDAMPDGFHELRSFRSYRQADGRALQHWCGGCDPRSRTRAPEQERTEKEDPDRCPVTTTPYILDSPIRCELKKGHPEDPSSPHMHGSYSWGSDEPSSSDHIPKTDTWGQQRTKPRNPDQTS